MSQPEKLSANQKKYLRSIAHNINPMIIIGANGVTDSLMAELESTLAHHELLKIKMSAADREDRNTITDYIIKETGALLVQSVGKTCTIYRQKEKTELPLPKK